MMVPTVISGDLFSREKNKVFSPEEKYFEAVASLGR
jgi:hypothetical protein